MATYKAEFFDHYYRGRLRPAAHYSAWAGCRGGLTLDDAGGAPGQRGPHQSAALGGPAWEASRRNEHFRDSHRDVNYATRSDRTTWIRETWC